MSSEKSKEYFQIIKWDVSLNKKLPIPEGYSKLASSYIGPLVVKNKDVYLDSIHDLFGVKYLKDSLKNFVLKYCKEHKVECSGEILAYVTKDEYAHKFPNKQMKIKITPNNIEYIPCSININAIALKNSKK